MSVYVTHESSDQSEASEICKTLEAKGISYAVDLVDTKVQSTAKIAAMFKSRVEESSHILIIVSNRSKDSWWVPFLIGAGATAGRRIASYSVNAYMLPDFLIEWPILDGPFDMDNFADKYLDDASVPESEGRSESPSITSAEEFHKGLKDSLL